VKNPQSQKAPRVVDLFSGCGGLSFGLELAGFHTSLAVDNWGDALDTFSANHPRAKTLLGDLGDSNLARVTELSGPVEIVVGGPPCQGFSISGKRDPNDPRNRLYQGFVNVVEMIRPPLFMMENVPNLASMDSGKLLEEIIYDFERLGYKTSHQILLASDYGVPQNRRRLILIGTRDKKPLQFSKGRLTQRDEKVTTFEAISDLPEESIPNGAAYPTEAESEYQTLMRRRSTGIWNHEITRHSEQTVNTIALVPDGGNYKDLPSHLQGTRKVNIAWTRYPSYAPSMTIDTGHRHHFHYKFNRVPTVRESARLQSFPDTFHFLGSKTSQYRQVGNAVPPLLAKELGMQLLNYLGG
jgi:DNA (cytosine-5)-methyltransferase 1